ncbi:MAG: hypothetical protein AB1632_00495 [Nitrospirota bacterium]
MLKKAQENFKKGIEKIKWFSALFSERIKIEIAVIRLLYQSDEMDKKREKLLKTIGERIVELKDHPDKNIFKDKVIADAVSEAEKLQKNIDELKQKASEISRVTG